MTVQSSARLSIAETASFYDWADPTKKSLLRGYDERSVLTEKRRAMVGDIGGGRRPATFIASTDIRYMPASRHSSTLRLRRLERKVLIWKGMWDAIFGLLRINK
jgi:hypothetical protein